MTTAQQVSEALSTLLGIGMDVGEAGKVRVAALATFVDKVGLLSGWAAAAKPKEGAGEEPTGDEGELLDRVAEALVKRPEGRAAIEAKLIALKGGKAE